MNTPDAVVRIEQAHYCVRLKLGKPHSQSGSGTNAASGVAMPVESQKPAAGARPRAWSLITLTIGYPVRAGMPKNKTSKVGVDTYTWGGGNGPCPPITAQAGR